MGNAGRAGLIQGMAAPLMRGSGYRRGRNPVGRPAMGLALLSLLAVLAQVVPAAAAEHCPSGNLLRGLAPVDAVGVEAPERLTDGVAVLEGDPWDSIWATRFRDENSFVSFDLRRQTTLRLLLVQADGNDRYQVDLSPDGEAWQSLDPIQRSQEAGLHERVGAFEAGFRYLRIRPLDGDGAFSISEVRAFCLVPSARPEIVIRKTPVPPELPPRQLQTAWGKMALVVLAFVVLLSISKRRVPGESLVRSRLAAGIAAVAVGGSLVWTLGLALGAAISLAIFAACGMWLRRSHTEDSLRAVACLGLIIASVSAWTNFGFFSGHYVHYHDAFHYYLGSKYVEEIGYTNLYRCAALADAEDVGPASVAQRPIRDLVTKARRPGHEVLARPELCKDAFQEARWETFKQDVAAFRDAMPASAWASLFLDHGYNPSPLWSAIGRALSFDDALTPRRLMLLALIDPLLYAAALAALAWAFGLATCALAAVVWATGMPWDFMWTGGAYARSPWLFAMIVSIAMAKKSRYAFSGAALAFSGLLRVFPAFLVTGPLFAMLGRGGPPATFQKRFVFGGALAGVLLVVGSAAMVGPSSYRDFVSNIHRHAQQPTRNQMGLSTLLAWHPERTAIKSYDFALMEPRAPWAAHKEQTLQERAPIQLAVVLTVLAGLWLASRRLETWKLMCLGVVLVGTVTELSSYYFVMLVAVAPLAAERVARYGPLLLGVFLMQFIPIAGHLNYEAPYVLSSALVLAVLLLIELDVVLEARRARGSAVTEGSSGVLQEA